ncbi:MAG: hypothetical protein IPN76_20390 [Saprospiraceae bacterium]|nr:hypothetical protein [Saprospiraceae bacterium]
METKTGAYSKQNTYAYQDTRPKLFTPPYRKLRGYAFDPSLSVKLDTAGVNELTYKVGWEAGLKKGPVGEYLEVMDYDPTMDKWYAPVDLNDPHLLAQDGLPPSESNPKFHQQMVYAVCMTTIQNFEQALGRKVLWSSRLFDQKPETNDAARLAKPKYEEYVQRLRVYPHAFRDANAFYSPTKKALLFGYFAAQPANATILMPNALVFTCLSHDIVAHETAHAILDGMYRHYTEDNNPDMLAFHEAFADIVALFQHFTFPDVLSHQIAKTRGDLASENLLGQLAQEFGSAVGRYGALRDALGSTDPKTGVWQPHVPTGNEYQTTHEPHERGSILVAAMFEAFVNIYKSRTADLLRIASGGTGILPQGQLHPDLVNRLADEAAKTAKHLLGICIRALDYCPPVDLNFGDYLRAMITADVDLISDDSRSYRLAIIDAFRKRGIYPNNIKSLSVESLTYPTPAANSLGPMIAKLTNFLREYRNAVMYLDDRKLIFDTTTSYIAGQYQTHPMIYGLHRRFYEKFEGSADFERLSGFVFDESWEKLGVRNSTAHGGLGPSFSVQSLRLASRVGPNGSRSNQIIISLTQRAGVTITEANDEVTITPFVPNDNNPPKGRNSFEVRGGVNLVFDLDTLKLKYAIGKPLLDTEALLAGKRQLNQKRILEIYRYFQDKHLDSNRFDAYFRMDSHQRLLEPFSFLHASEE